MKKSLQSLIRHNPVTIAKLKGMKSIARVKTTRSIQWWLVVPSVSGGDAQCVLLEKATWGRGCAENEITRGDRRWIYEYADRITA